MKILNFLWFWKKATTLTGLERQSAAILDVFTKTQKQCLKVNEEIFKLAVKKQETIKALQSEVSTLNSISAKNAKLAEKIETFLGE